VIKVDDPIEIKAVEQAKIDSEIKALALAKEKIPSLDKKKAKKEDNKISPDDTVKGLLGDETGDNAEDRTKDAQAASDDDMAEDSEEAAIRHG